MSNDMLGAAHFVLAAGGWENIRDNNALGISIAGLVIVFTALILVSLFIAVMPKALAVLERFFPEKSHHGAEAKPRAEGGVDLPLVAAVAYAVHLDQQRGDSSG